MDERIIDPRDRGRRDPRTDTGAARHDAAKLAWTRTTDVLHRTLRQDRGRS
jgi:hypothetical protein